LLTLFVVGKKHLIFYEKFSTSTNRTWLSYSQFVTGFQMVLFCGEGEEGCLLNLAENSCVVEGWVGVNVKSKIGVEVGVVKGLFRSVLDRCWRDGGKVREEDDKLFLRDTIVKICVANNTLSR